MTISFFPQTNSRAMLSMSCTISGIQSSFSCWRDFLKIGNKKYCGGKNPPTMTQSSFRVEFRSDWRKQYGGFRCTIQSTGK